LSLPPIFLDPIPEPVLIPNLPAPTIDVYPWGTTTPMPFLTSGGSATPSMIAAAEAAGIEPVSFISKIAAGAFAAGAGGAAAAAVAPIATVAAAGVIAAAGSAAASGGGGSSGTISTPAPSLPPTIQPTHPAIPTTPSQYMDLIGGR